MPSYYAEALCATTRQQCIDRVLVGMQGMQVDAIAVCGASGLAIGAIVADRLGLDLVIVRKDGDTSHGDKVTGQPQRYVIVDDFIDSGRTVKHIRKSLDGVCVGFIGYSELWQRYPLAHRDTLVAEALC